MTNQCIVILLCNSQHFLLALIQQSSYPSNIVLTNHALVVGSVLVVDSHNPVTGKVNNLLEVLRCHV